MLTVYLAVTLSILVLLGVTVAAMFKNQYIMEQELELRRETEEINAILIEKYKYSEKRPVAAEELRIIARKYDALIQVVDKQPSKISFIHPASEDKWAIIDGVDISGLAASIIDGSGGVSLVMDMYRGMTDMKTLTLTRPVINDAGERGGAIFFHVDMTGVNDSIRRVYLDVLLSACVAVLTAALAVSYITDRITRPVKEMNRIVNCYSKGDFDLRVPVESADEVGQLATTFNHMADELNTLEEARRSFVANVSHELRSPLTSMRGFLEAMQDGTIPPSEHEKYLEIVIAENKRMTDMVNDLLDLARIESGQYVLRTESFDIYELIRRTLITFETRIGDKNLDVAVDFKERACYAEADLSQITQVLRNLVDNAIKFSPEGGRLTLRAGYDRKEVFVSVADEGCGMAKEDLPYIFDRFYKAEKAHTPKGGSGTGLGLAIVKRIIDQHGQRIEVESEPGRGTKFTFSLKRGQEPHRKRANSERTEG